MIPYLLIIVAAAIGFFAYGLPGLVIGTIAGYLISLAIGMIGKVVYGGLVPRQEKTKIAANFIRLRPHLIEAAHPNLGPSEQHKVVEGTIERIFRRSVLDSQSVHLEAGWSRSAMQETVYALIQEEADPKKQDFLLGLMRQIEEDFYW